MPWKKSRTRSSRRTKATTKNSKYQSSRFGGFRSGFERKVHIAMQEQGCVPAYEAVSIPFIRPASKHKYTPDWVLPNGIVVEAKGYLEADARKKMVLVREQHPQLDLRFVIINPQSKVEGLVVRLAQWLDKLGIPWAHRTVPAEWMEEPPEAYRLAAVQAYQK